jgi:hypothetical protein
VITESDGVVNPPKPGDRVRINPGFAGDTAAWIGKTATVRRVVYHDNGWPSSIDVELDRCDDYPEEDAAERTFCMFVFDVEVLP